MMMMVLLTRHRRQRAISDSRATVRDDDLPHAMEAHSMRCIDVTARDEVYLSRPTFADAQQRRHQVANLPRNERRQQNPTKDKGHNTGEQRSPREQPSSRA